MAMVPDLKIRFFLLCFFFLGGGGGKYATRGGSYVMYGRMDGPRYGPTGKAMYGRMYELKLGRIYGCVWPHNG